MNKIIPEMLDEEIVNVLETMAASSPDSEEYSTMVSNLVKLNDMRNANDRVILDWKGDQTQKKSDRIEFGIRCGIEIAGIVLPLIFYGVWMKKGFQFEENGTFTSTTFRGLFNRFRPTKK